MYKVSRLPRQREARTQRFTKITDGLAQRPGLTHTERYRQLGVPPPSGQTLSGKATVRRKQAIRCIRELERAEQSVSEVRR